MKELLSKPAWDFNLACQIMDAVHAADLSRVSKEEKQQALVFSFYLGGVKASHLGYSSMVRFLLSAAREMALEGGSELAAIFPIHPDCIRLEEATYFSTVDTAYASTLVQALLDDKNLIGKARPGVTALRKLIDSVYLKASDVAV